MSAAGEGDSAPRSRGARCPTCQALVTWNGNANRPFCSLTCRLVDLGHWLDERYRVASEDDSIDDDEPSDEPGSPGARPDGSSRVP